jgi:type IV secretory pathway VirB10-like protein
LQKSKEKQSKSMNNLEDKVLDNPEVAKTEGEKGEKYNDLLQYLNTDPGKLVQENVIGQEELSKEDSLRSKILEQSNNNSGNRAIYKAENSVDPKYQKEDYEAEKQSFFAYSKTYKGATLYDAPEVKNAVNAQAKLNQVSEQSTMDDEEEFKGKSEKEIVQILTERYKNENAGGEQKKKTEKTITTAALIYNELNPVKCFEGQFLDCVLLHKLLSDTEESPVIVSVAKDFFDSSARFVIFPSGTRGIGHSQVVKYQGAARLYIWFERILLPNGVSIMLPDNGKGLDVQGSLGVASNVNRHFMQKFGSAIMVGLLDGLGGLAQNNTQNNQLQNMINNSSNNFSDINREIMAQNSNIVPTITVNAGHRVKIVLSSDILISAYSLISDRSYARGEK